MLKLLIDLSVSGECKEHRWCDPFMWCMFWGPCCMCEFTARMWSQCESTAPLVLPFTWSCIKR